MLFVVLAEKKEGIFMNKQSKGNKKVITAVTTMVVLAAFAIGVYYYLSNRPETTPIEKKTEVESILSKDFETSYPETPTEVVKMYCRMIQCMYNSSLKEDDIGAVMDKMRMLFSSELLENNPRDQHLQDLKKEINEYQKNKSTIANYTVEKNSSVNYKTVNEEELATLQAAILVNIKKSTKYKKSNEEFILKKEDKKWKIIGWKLVESTDLTDESQVKEFDEQAEQNNSEAVKETEQVK